MSLCKTCFLFVFLTLAICCTATQDIYANSRCGITTDTLPGNCSQIGEIEKIIDDAISLGAPIYNEGLHMACYRIYEWAAYKILYVYGPICKNVETILKTAVEKSHGDYSDTEKAWMMRAAFDKILGVPTQTNQPEKEPLDKNG